MPVDFIFGQKQIALVDKYGNFCNTITKVDGGPASIEPKDKNKAEIAKQS